MDKAKAVQPVFILSEEAISSAMGFCKDKSKVLVVGHTRILEGDLIREGKEIPENVLLKPVLLPCFLNISLQQQ